MRCPRRARPLLCWQWLTRWMTGVLLPPRLAKGFGLDVSLLQRAIIVFLMAVFRFLYRLLPMSARCVLPPCVATPSPQCRRCHDITLDLARL
jgi:hypothetical protein